MVLPPSPNPEESPDVNELPALSTNNPTDNLPTSDFNKKSIDRRRMLIADAILGFFGFFAGIAFIEAVVNLFRPEPAIMPAVVALVLVSTTVAVARWRRQMR